MTDRPEWSDLTGAEKRAVIRAEARGGVRVLFTGVSTTPDLDRKVQAVYDQAARRIARDAKKRK